MKDSDAAIEVVPHDEAACDFCRLMNEARTMHYHLLTHTLVVPASALAEKPTTAGQEAKMQYEVGFLVCKHCGRPPSAHFGDCRAPQISGITA